MSGNSSITALRPDKLVCEAPELQSFPIEPEQTPAAEQSICDRKQPGLAFEPSSEISSELRQLQKLPLSSRIGCITHKFLGLPFKADPLGEGFDASVDRDPMFRFDAHDCMTMIEHVMALASSSTGESFLDRLTEIRYRSATALYGFRLHFVSADWIPENSKNGFIKEITQTIGRGAVSTVSASIDRRSWVWNSKRLNALQKMQALGPLFVSGKYDAEYVEMDYIPTSAFFMSDPSESADRPNPVDLLPEVSIMLMIDDQKDIDKIGVIVRHMALLFKPKGGEPYIVHGSDRRGEIFEEPFLSYISSQEPYRAGVALFEILEK
jgi:N-acetylmuramoyl-L-alanine amidase-like protein